MRIWIVAFLLLAACKGKDKTKSGASEPAKAAAIVPAVSVASVLAKEEGRPPALYIVDDSGTVRLGAAKTWADLDANQLAIATKTAPLDPLDRFVREEYGLGREPVEAVKAWDETQDSDIDLSSLEDPAPSPSASQDDPPPPPEEDDPDDGADESGGTGTMIALDEGKMGKKDSDRAEGQYKMVKTTEDPQLARQQAIEQARNAGILAAGSLPYAARTKPRPNDDGTPTRVAEIAGTVTAGGMLEHLRAMILIRPTAKATKLIEVVRDTDAAIVVSHDGKIRPLQLMFSAHDSNEPSAWIEVRVSAKGLVIEAVPDAPINVANGDPAQLTKALEQARTLRGTDPAAPVDVLVDADIDAQHLIDVVVALDTAGVKVIGMGAAPSAEELARRGHRIPTTRIGQPNAQGDLDKKIIRRVVKASKTKITACYAKALAGNPGLAGTVQTQFYISPDGIVMGATASGVDPDVSTCVAGVIKSLEFPKPKGGGGVQVNYPFTMVP